VTVLFHRAAIALRHAPSVAVCGHVRPDGDALGSVLAATLLLRAAGVPAVPVLADPGPAPSMYAFLPGFALLAQARELEQPEAFLALDAPNADRLGDAAGLALGARTLVVMDHHPDAVEYGTVNVLDASTASTGQLVWRLAAALEVEPTPEIALCCFVALQTDTGRFQYSNTTPQALRDAADMVEAGADPAEASRLVYQSRSPGAMALEARTLSRMTLANGGRVVYSWIEDADFADTGARSEETEHLVDAIRVLEGAQVVALFRIIDGEVRANLRAKTGFDVAGVAKDFGGGGHAAAAGFTVTSTLDALLAELLPLLPGGGSA